ncbi:hypothetical protein L9F63_017735, partial [Diploptera punctata]
PYAYLCEFCRSCFYVSGTASNVYEITEVLVASHHSATDRAERRIIKRKSCPCAVYRVKWSKLAIIRWPLWSSVRFTRPSWKNVHHLETLLRSIQSSPYTPRISSFSRKSCNTKAEKKYLNCNKNVVSIGDKKTIISWSLHYGIEFHNTAEYSDPTYQQFFILHNSTIELHIYYSD